MIDRFISQVQWPAVFTALFMAGCSQEAQTQADASAQALTDQVSAAQQQDNQLMTESSITYGAPDFRVIDDAHFMPAFEQGMAEQAAEIDAIAPRVTKATGS